MLGTTEIILLGVGALMLFGGKKIPELMKGLGQGVRSFKDGMNEVVEDPKEQQDKSSEDSTSNENEPPKEESIDKKENNKEE